MSADVIFDLLKNGSAVDHKFRYVDRIGDQQVSKIKQRSYVLDALAGDRNDLMALRLAAGLTACSTRSPCNQPFCPMCRHARQAKFANQVKARFAAVPQDRLLFLTVLLSVHYDAGQIDAALVKSFKRKFRNLLFHQNKTAAIPVRMSGAFEIEAMCADLSAHKAVALAPLGHDKTRQDTFFLLHFHAVIDRGSLSQDQLRSLLIKKHFPHSYQVRLQATHSDKTTEENLAKIAGYMLKFRLQHSDRISFSDDDQTGRKSSYGSLYDLAVAKKVVMAVNACGQFAGMVLKTGS
ncbi:hypothetical protein [Paramagnetospirillum magneticum]|nr:hypothetical protein [Paramagnetospirillum magneticum]